MPRDGEDERVASSEVRPTYTSKLRRKTAKRSPDEMCEAHAIREIIFPYSASLHTGYAGSTLFFNVVITLL